MKNPLLVILLASASLVAACGSNSTPNTTGSSSGSSGGSSGSSGGEEEADAAPPANGVVVKSNVFVPATLTIKVGDTVTWTWAGGNHDVVSGPDCKSDGMFTSSLTSKVGTKFTHTFDKAGTFEYYCTPHCVSSKMIGTITVE